MEPNSTRKVSFEELADLLYREWLKGNLGHEFQDFVTKGLLPVEVIRQKLRWAIERSDEDGYMNITALY